ncbi:MAG: Mth938-like domain-containing protein [Rickettsiales bacterium]|nr:Mth938-like domain-containing protein [Rickettsiales bacterium]
MDITPQLSESAKVIDGYGDGGFTIAGERCEGAVLVLPEKVIPWPDVPAEGDSPALEHMELALNRADEIEILLYGSGTHMVFLPPIIRETLRASGMAVDVMDTGAACRTFNILLNEGRRVAALLQPV